MTPEQMIQVLRTWAETLKTDTAELEPSRFQLLTLVRVGPTAEKAHATAHTAAQIMLAVAKELENK